MRQTLSLYGTWDFQLDPHRTTTVDALRPDMEIIVPMPWQAAFPDLQRYSGFAWYRRSFDIDPVATAMFHDLLEHLVSDRCRPNLAIK